MAGVITNAGQLFDQSRHSRERPQLGLVTIGGRPFQEGIDQLLGLFRAQPAFGAGWTPARQGLHPAGLPGLLPTIAHLPSDSQTLDNLGHGATPVEHFCSPAPPPFQLRMISFLSHAAILP